MMATMCEIIDFVEPYKKGAYLHLLMNDNSCTEAGSVSAALPAGSELLRQDLCAELTTLNHYGLVGVGCALVDVALFTRGSIKARGARHPRLGCGLSGRLRGFPFEPAGARRLRQHRSLRRISAKHPKAIMHPYRILYAIWAL
jgi:hypothetical protein